MRRPFESAQYTSGAYTQTLTDHRVLGSIGSVGDAYDCEQNPSGHPVVV